MPDLQDRLALMQEAHRQRLEAAQQRRRAEREGRENAERQRSEQQSSAAQIEQQGALELARFHSDLAPTRSAVTLAEAMGLSLVRQGEHYSDVLGEVLRTKAEGAQALHAAFLELVGSVAQTRLAHTEAERTRRHERSQTLLAARQQEAQQRHALQMQQAAALQAAILEILGGEVSRRSAESDHRHQFELTRLSGLLSLIQTTLAQEDEARRAEQAGRQHLRQILLEGMLAHLQGRETRAHERQMAYTAGEVGRETYRHNKIVDLWVWMEMRKLDPLKASESQIREWLSEFEDEMQGQNN